MKKSPELEAGGDVYGGQRESDFLLTCSRERSKVQNRWICSRCQKCEQEKGWICSFLPFLHTGNENDYLYRFFVPPGIMVHIASGISAFKAMKPFEFFPVQSHVGGGFKGVHRFIVSNLRDRQISLLQKPVSRFAYRPIMILPGFTPRGGCKVFTLQDISHEAIIPRELFLQVREEMVRRARVKTGTGKRRVYSGKYALSHLIYCSDCGDLYRRTQWYLKGEHVPVWRCVSRLEKRKSGIDCPSRILYETDLHAAVITAF